MATASGLANAATAAVSATARPTDQPMAQPMNPSTHPARGTAPTRPRDRLEAEAAGQAMTPSAAKGAAEAEKLA
eukprot:10591084-Alexandrium_andersonii.AAC.1